VAQGYEAMNAASGSQPARGVVVGRLTASHPDRIVMGNAILYLRDGAACDFPVGTLLQVVYTEQDGRRHVESVTPAD
jgi:hypothetical protein